MSAGATGSVAGVRAADRPAVGRLGAYFWSDGARRAQTVLGLIWLLDGGLQFQSFMYSRGFVQMIASGAQGQPGWLHDSIMWGARMANGNIDVWNTLFALTQVAIGLGILYRPLAKLTLGASLLWVLIVWWFGEAFGMLFMDMAQPLTGAPGGVFMYGLIALIAWPNGRPGGLFGVRGAKTMWCALWLVMAWLWLLAPSSSANATKSMLGGVPSGIHPLDSLQNSLAGDAGGHGLIIALVLAALSAAIGIAVAAGWHPRAFLITAIVLNLVYWVIPQGLGGIFAGGATDVNSGPLFVLLACAMLGLFERRAAQPVGAPESLARPMTASPVTS
jgi:hypothetical protein